MIASILEHEDADTFLHPALSAIHLYDQEHKTDYFQTLYEYLMNMLDKRAAAAMLELHKNTFQYRLNRISELFDLDLEDAKTLMNLLLVLFAVGPHPAGLRLGQRPRSCTHIQCLLWGSTFRLHFYSA